MRANGFVTVVIPFAQRASEVERLLSRQTECGNQPVQRWRDALEHPIRLIHFLSIGVVDARSPMDASAPSTRGALSHLVIEISSDAGASETLVLVAKALNELLVALLDEASPATWDSRDAGRSDRIAPLLIAHSRNIGSEWGMAMGQVHDGSPGMTVQRILDEEALAKHVGTWIESQRELKDRAWIDSSAMQKVERIRDRLWVDGLAGKPARWVFSAEPAQILQGAPEGKHQERKAIFSGAYTLLWPLGILLTYILIEKLFLAPSALRLAQGGWAWAESALLAVAVAVVWTLWPPRRSPFMALVATAYAVVAILCSFKASTLWLVVASACIALGAGVAAAVAYGRLRRHEADDAVDDHVPGAVDVARLMDKENYTRQNHMFTISTIKPGLVRWFALRVILTAIGTNRFVSRPGFLGRNGVIHAARWLWIRDPSLRWFRWFDPGRLIFWSNYDSSWDSYVGDFIADSPDGVTGLWSNCIGFPRARNLRDEGARDRDRLVRWARRQQKPTCFWYSAYPKLTNDRIRVHAAIRQGLASAQSDADARNWLSLFGSQPRPVGTLASTEIPTLIFGGLKRLPFAKCYMIRFCDDDDPCRTWFRHVSKAVTFGDLLPGQKRAVALSLSARGLARLGVPPEAIATFPVAFQQGMWTADRARALGDEGDDEPSHWRWGSIVKAADGRDDDRTVDVFLVLYGLEPEDVRAQEEAFLLSEAGVRQSIVFCQTLRPAGRETECRPMRESRSTGGAAVASPATRPDDPFEFADGLSQPILVGSRRSGERTARNDLVGAGEFVLGYPDHLQRLPPTPVIDASQDPDHLLPDEAESDSQQTDLSRYRSSGRRDLGANGTFLVVRHLEQHVDAWRSMLKSEAERIAREFVVSAGADGAAIVWGEPSDSKTYSIDPEKLEAAIAAKLIGRWQDGSPLVRSPMMPAGDRAKSDNAFRFGVEDPQGLACPLGSHIRRANPRDSRSPGSQEEIDSVNRHRLLRVGRVYRDGVDDATGGHSSVTSTGLMFMCLNANIERQFEFVQKNWILNRNIHSLDDESDPLLGGGCKFSVPTPRGVVRIEVPRLVTVRGGGYFFMPGAATLELLRRGPGRRREAATKGPADRASRATRDEGEAATESEGSPGCA